MDCVGARPQRHTLVKRHIPCHYRLSTSLPKDRPIDKILTVVQACPRLRRRVDMSPSDLVLVLAIQDQHVRHPPKNFIADPSISQPIFSCKC